MSKKNDVINVTRDNPPVFPMGFRVGMSDDICIIDFMDLPDDGVRKISYSIAITRRHAEDLIEHLSEFIKSDTSD